jgi:hypothetical protein
MTATTNNSEKADAIAEAFANAHVFLCERCTGQKLGAVKHFRSCHKCGSFAACWACKIVPVEEAKA